MTGVFLSAVAVILVAGTALMLASTLGLRDPGRLLLGAYVIGFAEVVGLTLLLSAFAAVTRPAILLGVAVLFAASVAAWRASQGTLPRAPLRTFLELRRSPLSVVLAAGVALSLLYVLALIVGTPPNNWDALTYHLARAAFWRQEGRVGYIADAYDERLNVNPPNSEVAVTFLLEVGRDERLAGFVQLAAALAIALGVFALARTLGIGRREAAFGALLVLTLPIILLQASTAQNDLVAASFLVAATVFLLGNSRRDLVLAALATALALGTKIPAAYGLPILAAVALVAAPRTSLTWRLVAIVVGAGVGSYWYVVNVVETGHPVGELARTSGLVTVLEPTDNLLAAYARALDALDLSGARGADLLVYAIVAAGVAIAVLVRRSGVIPALATGALILAPLFFVPAGYVLWRAFAKLHDVLGEPDGALPVRGWDAQTTASDSLSWFGPLGLLLVVGVGVASVILVRRGALPPLALVFAGAPLASFVLLALTIGYDEWQGRFFVFPIGLSASLWGLVMANQRYAVAAVAIALTTAGLSLVHFKEKPSGVRLLEGAAASSIWGVERWQAQSVVRSELGPVLRILEHDVPDDAVVALALGEDDFGFPAFGPRLEREVELIPVGSSALTSGAEWLLAAPKRAGGISPRCWHAVPGSAEGWTVFRRRSDDC